MNTDLKQLYNQAFHHLELAKLNETNDRNNASDNYHIGLQILQQILQYETNIDKRALVADNLRKFGDRLHNLQLQIQLTDLPPPPVTTNRQVVSESNPPNAIDKIKEEADRLFKEAIEIDEKRKRFNTDDKSVIQACIDNYITAAEYCIKNKILHGRVKQLLDQIEYLKSLLVEKTFTEASALMEQLPEAPMFMSTTASDSNDSNQSFLKETFDYDEQKWKGANKKGASVQDQLSSTTANLTQKGGGLSESEIAVLRTSSIINGKVYQPWLPGEEENERFRFDHPFCDPDGLMPFSQSQIDSNAEWRRPREFIIGEKPSMIEMISPLAIQQELVSDCSFVCSLCIAAAYEAKFRKHLITSIIYPQNSKRIPIYNPFGKYLIKLYLNGVQRKVVVDDRLPVCSRTGSLLCSKSSNPRELWVSIIEKAYMKVNGGYDFPGSNSGIDLYALTGWIPEHIFFREDDSETEDENHPDHRQGEDRAWQRLQSAHGFGDCLVTISTGMLSSEDQSNTGLVPGHAYAVLDVKEAGTLRILKVKNPWNRRPWIGRFSSRDRERWTSGLMKALSVSHTDFDEMEKNGIFWIEFKDCRRYFKSFFLNWNPKLFSFRTVYHDCWPVSLGPKNDKYFVGENPQYCLIVDHIASASTTASTMPSTQTIWILISRHITRRDDKSQNKQIAAQLEADIVCKDGDFLALHVHRLSTPGRVYASNTPFISGIYSNDPHILVRIDVNDTRPSDSSDTTSKSGASNEPSTSQNFTLVMSQTEKFRDVSYTLNVLGTVPFRFYPAPQPPPNKVEFTGSWSSETSGGSMLSPKFYCNPQYRIVIGGNQAIHIHIQAFYPKEIYASISVCKSGNRLDSMTPEDEVLRCQKYRPGYCCCEGSLLPGNYTCVLSTYETHMTGNYKCTIRSSINSIGVAEIEPEGLKGYKALLKGTWSYNDGTAVGCSNHGSYHLNPAFVFQTNEEVKMTARLNKNSGPLVSLNLALYSFNTNEFPIPLNANPKRATHSSGTYTDQPCGVVLNNVNVPAGTWVLVPSTFDPIESDFIIILSFSKSQPITISRLR